MVISSLTVVKNTPNFLRYLKRAVKSIKFTDLKQKSKPN